jgi:hypothetical protein
MRIWKARTDVRVWKVCTQGTAFALGVDDRGYIGFAVIGLDILRRFLDGGHSEAAKVCSTCVVFVLKWVVCWTILSCKLGIECVLFFLSYSITLVVILITKKGTGGFFCS